MTLAKSCPGSRTIREPVPESIRCTSCGQEVEIWTDELSATCRNCGTRVFKEERPSCIDWCPHAKECVGVEALQRLRPALGEKAADGGITTVLDIMKREHEEAQRQLGSLRAATLCLRVSTKPSGDLSAASSPVVAKAIADLDKLFAFFDAELKTHFRHEEEALFPVLEQHLGKENSPTQLLLGEHGDLWPQYERLKEKVAGLLKVAAECLPAETGEIHDISAQIA
ncbi:MAG: hemerythrin domain-containing protein, partial [Chloroflexi bacterium]|nr:hemerythrin domain-containing protein [Chloroflexota bacterium]